MVYLNPRPVEKDSQEYYRHEEYLPFSSAEENHSFLSSLYRMVRKLNLRWKGRLIEHYWRGGSSKPPGSLLDVGCGTGEFLAALQRLGWDVTGLERDEKASSWARKALNLNVHTGDLNSLPTGEGPFDVITMWHVLEHLYDPVDAVRKLTQSLGKNGFLLIALPNVEGIDARAYKENWIAYDTPRHVNHFSPATLERLAGQEGLVTIARRQLPFDAPFNTLMSEQLAARRANSNIFVWPFRMVRAGILSALSLLGGSRLFNARRGATLVFLFQKAPTAG